MAISDRRRWFMGAGWILMLAVIPGASADITVFSAGMVTPESISAAPTGFGSYAGSYFIPDFGLGRTGNPADSNIWVVSPGGGAPTVFANNPTTVFRGGVFLPDNWGANAGQFLTAGFAPGSEDGLVQIYNASGAATLLQTIAAAPLTSALAAPSGFGSFAGQVLIGSDIGSVFSIAPSGAVSTVASGLAISPFGMVLAPQGFGALGGRLLLSDEYTGEIDAIDANGNVAHFATLSLAAGQTGLRQMAFAPAGFIAGQGSVLLVSVSGSDYGGGTLGDVIALDSNGTIVASLRTLGLTKFDPRGLLFRPDGSLLISDASDPILLASGLDFQIVPEPSSLLLLGSGLAGILGAMRVWRTRAVGDDQSR